MNIHEPKIILDDNIFKKKGGIISNKSSFDIRRINIKNGELIYKSKKIYVNLVKFDLYSFKKADDILFKLASPHLKIILLISKKEVVMEGAVTSDIIKRKTSIKINNFFWNTKSLNLNVNGRILKNNEFSLNTVAQGDHENILYPILKKLTIKGFTYSNTKIVKDKDGIISVNGKFKSPVFSSAGEDFSDLNGRLRWDSQNKHFKVNATFVSGLTTLLKVDRKDRKTNINLKNMYANKCAKVIKIYADLPVGSIVKEADVLVKGKLITGNVYLKKHKLDNNNEFDLDGKIEFRFNKKDRSTHFISDEIFSRFGKASIKGESYPKAKKLSLEIRSRVNEMGHINKYLKYYADLDLSMWNLKSGSGYLNLKYNKRRKEKKFQCDLNISNMYSRNQKIRSFKGNLRGKGELINGVFSINDENLKATSNLSIDKKKVIINVDNVVGESNKILKILNLDILLTGKTNGNFVYTKMKNASLPLITGKFRSKVIDFYGFRLDNVRSSLTSNTYYISLKDFVCNYKNGNGKAAVFIDYDKKKYKIDGNLNRIDLHTINEELMGTGDIFFKGEGDFLNDPINVNYQLADVLFYKDKKFGVKGNAEILTDFSEYRLKTSGNIIYEVNTSPFSINFNQKDGIYMGSFNLNLKDINLIIPWGNNRGEMELSGEILTQDNGEILTQGYANFKGEILAFPNFPHELDDFHAFITFKNLHFTLQSLQATMGGGAVEGNGYVIIKDNELQDLLINYNGKNMTLYPMDRTSCDLNANLSLKYVNKKLLLQGTLNFLSAIWEREIYEDIYFSTRSILTPSESKILDMLEFDLKLMGKEAILVDNTFGKMQCQFDLQLAGNYDFPELTGVIESREGGIYFSDRMFDIIKAKMVFNNKYTIDPSVDVESELFLKDYRIKFNIKGTSSHPTPAFSASPPLPPQDILALISMGELFKRPTSTTLSSRIVTTGMFTTPLTDQIKKRTKKLFGDYILKINPNIDGTSLETLTIGKPITKNLIVVYSTKFSAISSRIVSTLEQGVVYFQYQLSPTVSLIGMRNEEGNYSLDLRFRKRH